MRKKLLSNRAILYISSIPILLVICLFAGSFLRFYNLGDTVLYWDEPLHCIRIAYQPLPFVIAHNDASAFFAILVHFLLPLGKIEIMARLPSAVFGILTILAVYLVGKVLFSKREGLIGAAFVTFSPLLIRFSQYSRAYSTFTLFSLLSLYFFLRAIKENKTKLWGFYGLSTVINIYNHLMSLFILPAYGIFIGIIWLNGWWRSKKLEKKNLEFDKLKKFAIWTFLALIVIFLLYLPDESAKSFISASLDRARDQASDASLSLLQIKDILVQQIAPRNIYFFLVMVFFALIGLVSQVKKHALKAVFCLIYIFLPFLIFTLIKTNLPHILSVWRYLIFILPIIFLFISKGMTTIAAVISSLFAKLKPIRLKKKGFEKAAVGVFTVLLIGGGLDHKGYYLSFWRLSSLKIEKEVSDFLKENINRDALIYFDSFPASNLVIAANPLTKDMKTHEIELIIRDNLEINKDKHDIMFYRINFNLLKFMAPRPVDLWAVAKIDPEKQQKILPLSNTLSQVKASHLENHTIFHFKSNEKPIGQKLVEMSEFFLSLNLGSTKEKDSRLLVARNYLIDGRFEEGLLELNTARQMELIPYESTPEGSPLIFRLLDKLFGLNHKELRRLNQVSVYDAIASSLLTQGDNFRARVEYGKALQAYNESLSLSQIFNSRIANRLASIANKFFNENNTKDAISFFKKATQLSPQRHELNFLLAESYRKEGFFPEAEEEYRKAFGVDSLPTQLLPKLFQTDPLVIIWKIDSKRYLIFRSEKKSDFSGKILGSKRIKNVKKRRFTKKDALQVSEKIIELDFRVNRGKIKILDISTSKNCKLTLDITINERRDHTKIIVLDRKTNLQINPSTLD